MKSPDTNQPDTQGGGLIDSLVRQRDETARQLLNPRLFTTVRRQLAARLARIQAELGDMRYRDPAADLRAIVNGKDAHP